MNYWKPLILDEQNFGDDVLDSRLPVLVEFLSEGCEPCATLGPIVDRLAETFGGSIRFGKVNVVESAALARRFEVRSIPTLLLFEEGRVVDRLTGIVRNAELKARLQALLPAA